MAKLTPESVEVLVLHASATTPSMDVGVKEIDRWHRKKGWLQIGYHDVIRRDGTYEQGRPLPKIGAHAKGYNHMSIGICLVGGLNEAHEPEDNFTDAQKETLKNLIEHRAEEYQANMVIGHGSLPGVHKECPVIDVHEFLKDHDLKALKG